MAYLNGKVRTLEFLFMYTQRIAYSCHPKLLKIAGFFSVVLSTVTDCGSISLVVSTAEEGSERHLLR